MNYSELSLFHGGDTGSTSVWEFKFQNATSGGLWLTASCRLNFEMREDEGIMYPYQVGRSYSPKKDFSPSWSPDGRIVYSSFSEGQQQSQFWSVSADGSNPRQITSTSEFKGSPIVLPDGRFVAYAAAGSGGAQGWLMKIDGSDPRQITKATTDEYGAPAGFSPDGRWLHYTLSGNNKFALWKVAADGTGEAVKISDKITGVAVSPDGKQIAYVNIDAKPQRIEIVPIDGGEPLKTFSLCPTCGGPVRWSPDGRSLVMLKPRKRVLAI